MTERLDGTVAVVTGASSGIGEAAAFDLAAHGAAVSLVARRRDRLETLAERIRKAGGRALVQEADITNETEARRAIEQTVSEFGGLDTLVNNAGVMYLGPITGADVSEWQRMMDLNVAALMYCTHAALPHLVHAAEAGQRRVADIINVSSVAGRTAVRNAGVYNASKHAIGAFSESLRQEVTRKHVRVSLIEPGAVTTELLGHNRPEVIEMLRANFGELERLTSEDIAHAISFVVTQPRRVAINEILIRPTEQER